MKSSIKLIGTAVLAAIASSLCCITPLLALISGMSGIASSVRWLTPFRPFFLIITVVILVVAWYQKLKPRKQEEIRCACEEDDKPSFWQSKKFLAIVTIFVTLTSLFPYYSAVFYPKSNPQSMITTKPTLAKYRIKIEGMTCQGCVTHISNTLLSNEAITKATINFDEGNGVISVDNSKFNKESVEESLKEIGYSVTKIEKMEANNEN